MTELESFQRLGLALVLGLLIGLERGWHGRAGAEGSRVAGIRTFGIIGFLGGISAMLAGPFGLWLPSVAFGAIAILMIRAYALRPSRHDDVGATTTVASLVTFLLGTLAVSGDMAIAAAGAVVLTLLLGIKPILHGWLRRIEYDELLAVLKLLLISVVLLPVLPDRGYGPWGALNPYEIWWMVVLVAGISFCGYASVRLIGQRRGLLATGLLGGLTSSTVVMLSFARLSRRNEGADALLAAGAVAASATMFLRVMVILAIVAPALLVPLAPPFAAATALSYAGVLWLSRRGARETPLPDLRMPNPFEFGVALQFGLLLAAILVLARALPAWLGAPGLYLLGAVSGLADVDAITLSMARGTIGADAGVVAGNVIVVAALANTATKIALALIFGSAGMAWRVALVLGLAILAACILVGLALPFEFGTLRL